MAAESSSEKTIRLTRPSVVVLCGPAACGKSTFAQRHFRVTQVISSDWARGRVCDDESDQRFQAAAFDLVYFLIDQRLSLNRLCVVDSTALTPQARRELLELAREHRVPCVALLFDVALEKCIERDAGRERRVGRAVVERQYQFFEQAKATIRQEGFEQVIVLRDEELDKVRIEIVFRPAPRPGNAERFGGRPPRREPRSGYPPREVNPAAATAPVTSAPHAAVPPKPVVPVNPAPSAPTGQGTAPPTPQAAPNGSPGQGKA